jgi:Ni/Co efflux regulator RcnB
VVAVAMVAMDMCLHICVSQFPKWQANKYEKKEKKVEENGLKDATKSRKKYNTKRQTKKKKAAFVKGRISVK